MRMKKVLSILLAAAFFLLRPAALAVSAEPADLGAAIVTCVLPEGAEVLPVGEASGFAVPEGLEGMYALMTDCNADSDVYLFRMRHGRALASVSSTTMPETGSAQSLAELWPKVAESISQEAQYVNPDAGCASVAERFGYEALVIQTDIALDASGSMALLTATGTAFYRGTELIEIWAVAPADSLYLYDDAAAAELNGDLADLELLLANMDFAVEPEPDGGESEASEAAAFLNTTPYADPAGRFTLDLPAGARLVTRQTDEQSVTGLRAEYGERFGEGALAAFDLWLQDVQDMDATLLVSPDAGFAAKLCYVTDGSFAGMDPERLLLLADELEKSLADRYGYARYLEGSADALVSGEPHALLSFWMRSGSANIRVALLCAADAEGNLREVDLFQFIDQSYLEKQNAWIRLLLETLRYTAPQDALRI